MTKTILISIMGTWTSTCSSKYMYMYTYTSKNRHGHKVHAQPQERALLTYVRTLQIKHQVYLSSHKSPSLSTTLPTNSNSISKRLSIEGITHTSDKDM
jgi:hypothetical protein